MSDTVEVRREGAAARIVLNRPEALNAWNAELGLALRDAVLDVAGDPEVRAVLLTGAGRAFSSGADLKDLSGREETTASGRPDVRKVLTERYHPIITAVREMPKPVVAAVNGPAVGIGLSLALAADLVIAAESAYLLLAFVNVGLVPDGGSSVFVPARVGFARAAEMAMLGERVGAAQALEWGLVNRVVARRRARGRRRGAPAPPGGGADGLLRGHEAPAQRLAVRRHGGAARARGRRPAGDGGVGRLRGGRRRFVSKRQAKFAGN